MTAPRNVVGPVVKQIRKEKGLTQAALSAKLNLLGWDISRDTLAKLECQARWVADFELVKLAQALHVDPGDLLRRAGKSTEQQSLNPNRPADDGGR
jgi:transcriptional regulator with XRE-family HTH domain